MGTVHISLYFHPMTVAPQVAVRGGDENQFIAALLHDVVEDGGIYHRDVIERRFGKNVVDIVMGCAASRCRQMEIGRLEKRPIYGTLNRPPMPSFS